MLHDETRLDEILGAAETLFRTKGYRSTSMADVAEACHFQKAALYYHFASKEALALAVMKRVQTFSEKIIFSFAYDPSLKPLDKLLKLNEALEAYYLSGHGGCLFAAFAIEQMDTIPSFTAPIQQYFNSWSKAYETIFLDVFNSDKAHALAEGLVSDLQGALLMLRVTQDPKHLYRLFGESRQLLLSGPSGEN
ncbi:MAG TPA: helix-turn-helix domain-containing protein [Methylocella sp.]|nr:helix-turn-helix domain-containing protein [Methylocella sp.]